MLLANYMRVLKPILLFNDQPLEQNQLSCGRNAALKYRQYAEVPGMYSLTVIRYTIICVSAEVPGGTYIVTYANAPDILM